MFIFGSVEAMAQKSKKKKKGKVEEVMEIKNDKDSISYSIGVNIAKDLASRGMDSLNLDMLAQAMKDVLNNDSLLIDEQQCQMYMQQYMQKMMIERANRLKREGQKFLEQNGKREEVVTLPSGLQYEVLVEGNGPKPGPTSKVKCHYHGTLTNGEVFDSSVEKGKPIEYSVNGFIKGWQEALQLMSVGSKWKIYVPYDLGYGERGSGAKIGPYSTLVFEMELIDILD